MYTPHIMFTPYPFFLIRVESTTPSNNSSMHPLTARGVHTSIRGVGIIFTIIPPSCSVDFTTLSNISSTFDRRTCPCVEWEEMYPKQSQSQDKAAKTQRANKSSRMKIPSFFFCYSPSHGTHLTERLSNHTNTVLRPVATVRVVFCKHQSTNLASITTVLTFTSFPCI